MTYTIPYKEKIYFEKWIGSLKTEDRLWIDASRDYSVEQAYTEMRLRKHLEQTIGFDYWCAFNFQGHSKVIQDSAKLIRIANLVRYGFDTSFKPQLNNEITRFIEEAKKALNNYFDKLAIETNQHILNIYGGGYQPKNKQPHFHNAVKFEKTILPIDGEDSFLWDWRNLNPSRKSNTSAWAQVYDNQKNGIGYQENHMIRGIEVHCPRSSRRCKKRKCKGVRIFNNGSDC